MKRQGFTLVELLVCIAIIMLLIALLMPLIGAMRDNAKRVVCTSNLRQLSILWLAYIQDFGGSFPTKGNSVQTYHDIWGKRGVEYGTPAERRLFGIVFPNVDVKIYQCPADSGAVAAGWPWNRLPTVHHHLGYSYMFNTSASNNNDAQGLFRKKVGSIRNPSMVVAAGDYSFSCAYFVGRNPFHYAYWHHRRELGWGNVLFVDGSVQYKKIPDVAHFQQGPGYTFFWDGPR
ncbi:type II secretion system protein [Planctomycetota bacterium]